MAVKIASLPMRNWNPGRLGKELNGFFIASLPMRNWNSQRGYKRMGKISELPAYLWGIETFFGLNYIYGGLKLPAYLWGIETLAERIKSLKLMLIASLPMRNWNGKHSQVFVYDINSIASLPMRNWNAERERIFLFYAFQLPAYLWGIETLKTVTAF